jgi:hypothetical protein
LNGPNPRLNFDIFDIGADRDLRRSKIFDLDQGRSVLYDDDLQKLFVQVMVVKPIV